MGSGDGRLPADSGLQSRDVILSMGRATSVQFATAEQFEDHYYI